jgi:hypothetical protein
MNDDLVRRLNGLAAVEGKPTAGALKEAADRIEKLEAALRDCVNVLACFERPDFYQLEQTSPIKPYALGALDVARKALEGKDD